MSKCCHAITIVYINKTRKTLGPVCTACANECELVDEDGTQTRGTAIPTDYLEGIEYMQKRFIKK